MKYSSPILMLIVLFILPPHARAQDLRRTYVGGSGCNAEFQRPLDITGTRLDRGQRTYLKVYMLHGRKTLFIVQYADEQDQCGTIRDLVQAKDNSTALVVNCTDPKAPNDVVIGTWSTEHRGISGRALEAWRIDLRQLKFTTVNGPVQCLSGPGAGADEGGDLATLAKSRRPQK